MAITRPKAHQIDFDLTNITDPLVRINSGQTTANDKDIGLVLERGSDTNVALIWDESADEFALINTSEDGTTNGNVTISSYAGLQADAIVYGSLNDGTTTLTATVAELNYVDGVTSAIQTQLDSKTSNTGTVTSVGGTGTVNGLTLSGTVTTSGSLTLGGTLSITESQISDLGSYATIASPTLTGTPAAPTATAGTNTTQIATTAFVSTAVANIVDSAPGTLDTLNELAAALGDDANFSTTVTTSIGEKLAKASNLSDLTNAATARTNLGLGTAATSASTDYATSAQGTTADAALARSGGTITGDVTLSGASIFVPDNEAVRFGAGEDLVIFHDGVGGGSYINEAGSGNLFINGQDVVIQKYGTSEVMADFNADGAVQLYYNNLVKLQTTTTGAKISGDATTDAELMLHPGTNTDPVISFQGQSGDTTSEGAQIWYDNSVGDFHIVSSYDHANGGIRFHTRQPGHLQEGNERLTIAADGNIGIGDTSPQRKLSVDGIAKFRNTITLGGSNSSTDYNAYFANEAYANNINDTTVTLGTHSTRPLIFATNTTERMRIDSSGNVGIGSNNPAVPLHVYKSTSTTSSTTGTTLARFDNYVGGDLNQQKTFIDFKFQDDNTNETPQVRIGAEVGHNGDANSQQKEGSGAFVVYTNNAESVSGDAGASLTEKFRVDYVGNVGIGTSNPSYKLEVSGTIHGSGNITTGGVFSGTATSAQYADLAEKYLADEEYEPGTVLIIGGDAEVTACEKYRDSRLAGVVSTNPAYLMNTNLEGENVVELALMGRVPCKVTGLINKGDLLTTSSTKGVATVYNSSDYIPGTIIGKALESYSDSGIGVIEILVGKV